METAFMNSAIGILLGKINNMIEENMKLRKELKADLLDIKYEMGMMFAAIQEHAVSNDRRLVSDRWVREVQELAYDIEDCIDFFIDGVTCEPDARWLLRKLHQAKTKDARTQFARDIRSLRERAHKAYERKNRYLQGNAAAPSDGQGGVVGPSTATSARYSREADLVGITESKREMVELLQPAPGGQPEQLKVISIVGFRGMGKTTLAEAVFYSPDVVRQFPCRAWVAASEYKSATELLAEIHRQVGGATSDTTTSAFTVALALMGEDLRADLQKKEGYLIVIDDMQTEVWETINFAFPDKDITGRIIVTTSIQSVAKTCSSDGGYVYRMQALSTDHSKALLMKRVFGSGICSPDFETGSESILKICDGLPLALVNIAQFLRSRPDQLLTGRYCKDVCTNLGSHLEKTPALARMQQVLIHSYDNLPGYDLKTCLLSVSIYPKDHEIKRKNLVRRWLAEGLVVRDGRRDEEDVACGHFEELMDRNIIEALDVGNKAEVKTCHVHGVMLDFIVRKSVSENFITLIHNDELLRNEETNSAVRRLSLHNATAESGRMVLNIDLSRIRSLTIFEHVGQDLVDFRKCKLLRVLDLENCRELQDNVLDDLCKLVQLKYFSLRGTNVSKLPREISKLQYLDTLDVRETRVNILPMEVLHLPRLAHLFGRFKLPCQLSKAGTRRSVQTFFSERSKLQTLAGFVMDEKKGFELIMIHMSKLKKLKIWSESTPSSISTDILVASLQKRFIGSNALQSLSIDFADHSLDFMQSLNVPCMLTSIKLHGKLARLPDFVTSLHDLSELHLFSTGLGSQVLSGLQTLRRLLYLKLVEDCTEFVDGSFSVQPSGFPSLQRLCIDAPKLPQMSIAEGAMRHLASLQLISAGVDGLPVYTIRHLEGLREVTLHSSLSEHSRQAWSAEAKQHKNRPKITLYQV